MSRLLALVTNRAKHTKNQQKCMSPLMPTLENSAYVSLLLLAGETKTENWHFTFTILLPLAPVTSETGRSPFGLGN